MGLRDGAFNAETRVDTDGHACIMVGLPRGVGNCLCDMLKHANKGKAGLVMATLKVALRESVGELSMTRYDSFLIQWMLFSDHDGPSRMEYTRGFKVALQLKSCRRLSWRRRWKPSAPPTMCSGRCS
ncbi:hypothetical protein DWV42_08965 [Collinsella sp. AF05-8-2]|nr:hypothetical protein DWV42_08965 [Collinsella sp. AF05-8-2]RGW95237.1 hypothetical protein DWV43_00025 [Collinsella sp. AF05-9]